MAENIAARIIDEDEPIDHGTVDGGTGLPTDRTSQLGGTLPGNVREFQPAANLGGIPLISPLNIGTGGTSGGFGTEPRTRRRGRPPGSINRPRDTQETSAQLDLKSSLSNIEDLLTSIHWGTARLLDMSELELTADDSRQLSRAIRDCLKHYQFNIDPKKMALGNLMMVAGGIYAPRVMAIYRRGEKKPATVTPIDRVKTGTTNNAPGPVATPPPSNSVAPRNAAPRVPSEMDLSPVIDGFES